MDWLSDPGYWTSRLVFSRGLAFVYLVAFLVALLQFRPLIGTSGQVIGGNVNWKPNDMLGVGPDYVRVRNWPMASGEFFTDRDVSAAAKVCVIGRTLVTRVGKLELRVPQDRQGHFRTEVFEHYQRSEKALVGAMAEMYVQGVSKRKVKAITEELCGHAFSASATVANPPALSPISEPVSVALLGAGMIAIAMCRSRAPA